MNKLKMLIVAALLVWAGTARAQYGALRVDNSNNVCDVIISMLAIDPSSGYPSPCAIQSPWIRIPAGDVWSWCSVWDFQGPLTACSTGAGIYAPGWSSIPGLPAASSGFDWTDVYFQFGCPDWALAAGYSNAGGVMSDPHPMSFTCNPGLASWTTPPPTTSGPYSPLHGSWRNVTCPVVPCFGNAVTLTFN